MHLSECQAVSGSGSGNCFGRGHGGLALHELELSESVKYGMYRAVTLCTHLSELASLFRKISKL